MTKDQYINSSLDYKTDGLKHPLSPNIWIMEKWEKPIIQKSIEEIFKVVKPKTVLEVGFGYGYTASAIQSKNIDRHIILEAHPDIYRDALEWKKQYPDQDIEIINIFVQDFKTDEQFDLIYDDRQEMVYKEQGVDWSKFGHKWFAPCYIIYYDDKSNTDYEYGFWFFSSKKWYQPLIKNNA